MAAPVGLAIRYGSAGHQIGLIPEKAMAAVEAAIVIVLKA